VLRSGWVTQGPEVAAFESEFAAYLGSPHACAVSSCTAALHLALLGVGVKPGDDVITASHSFIATANAIRYCAAIPVFIDINPKTLNMEPDLLERVITPRTRAILCVHQMGMPCDLNRILAIARNHGIPVVEDAACAVGSEILWHGKWERIGKPRADVACFSFHPRKVITTGDGGMLTTANPAYDAWFRLGRQHSMSFPDMVRHQSENVIFENYTKLGFNYRMTDIQAAVGRQQLKRLPGILARRRELAHRYQGLLYDIPGLGLPLEPSWARSNWQSFCVRLPEGLEQKEVMQAMLNDGIATRRGIMCIHREPAYEIEPWTCGAIPGDCNCHSGNCPRLAESAKAQDRCIILPLFHDMTENDQAAVALALRRACRR
jgi:perosamine synthetase